MSFRPPRIDPWRSPNGSRALGTRNGATLNETLTSYHLYGRQRVSLVPTYGTPTTVFGRNVLVVVF